MFSTLESPFLWEFKLTQSPPSLTELCLCLLSTHTHTIILRRVVAVSFRHILRVRQPLAAQASKYTSDEVKWAFAASGSEACETATTTITEAFVRTCSIDGRVAGGPTIRGSLA